MSDRTEEIRTKPDTPMNRGWLEGMRRFGTPTEQQAARTRLAQVDNGRSTDNPEPRPTSAAEQAAEQARKRFSAPPPDAA